jgi:putative ABC transport system substrate-binding protein
VALKVDVIVAWSLPASKTAREATARIPIVMVNAFGAGLIESLARPGGNVTGMTSMLQDLGGKLLELLHQVFAVGAPRRSPM